MTTHRDVRLLDADEAIHPYRTCERGNASPGPRQIGIAGPAPRYLWKLLTAAEHEILAGLRHVSEIA